MTSIPASSAIRARARQSGQLPDQRSGTSVTARPDEQLAPNNPSFSLFALYIAARSPCPIWRYISRSLYRWFETFQDVDAWAMPSNNIRSTRILNPSSCFGKEDREVGSARTSLAPVKL